LTEGEWTSVSDFPLLPTTTCRLNVPTSLRFDLVAQFENAAGSAPDELGAVRIELIEIVAQPRKAAPAAHAKPVTSRRSRSCASVKSLVRSLGGRISELRLDGDIFTSCCRVRRQRNCVQFRKYDRLPRTSDTAATGWPGVWNKAIPQVGSRRIGDEMVVFLSPGHNDQAADGVSRRMSDLRTDL
jgi:hypothetical protein